MIAARSVRRQPGLLSKCGRGDGAMDVLLLRLDAPLMSFGTVQIDQHGRTQNFPTQSMLTGLLANALGYGRNEGAKHQRLQDRLRFAVRCDREGAPLLDFQTADLSQDFLRVGWTTSGHPEGREGGSAGTGTTIRYHHYLADAVYTVGIVLIPSNEEPRLMDISSALNEPQRPLYIGRKPCLPSTPVYLMTVQAESVREAVVHAPSINSTRRRNSDPVSMWWPESDGANDGWLMVVTDERDWENRVHVGRRYLRAGRVLIEEAADVS